MKYLFEWNLNKSNTARTRFETQAFTGFTRFTVHEFQHHRSRVSTSLEPFTNPAGGVHEVHEVHHPSGTYGTFTRFTSFNFHMAHMKQPLVMFYSIAFERFESGSSRIRQESNTVSKEISEDISLNGI